MEHLDTIAEMTHGDFLGRLYRVKPWFSDEDLRIMVYWNSPSGEIEIFNTAYDGDRRKILFHPPCTESNQNYTKYGSCSKKWLDLVFGAIHISEQRSKETAWKQEGDG